MKTTDIKNFENIEIMEETSVYIHIHTTNDTLLYTITENEMSEEEIEEYKKNTNEEPELYSISAGSCFYFPLLYEISKYKSISVEDYEQLKQDFEIKNNAEKAEIYKAFIE